MINSLCVPAVHSPFVYVLPRAAKRLILTLMRLSHLFAAMFTAVLLLTTPRAFSQVPSEAVGFSGDGLHLYPLGWSSEGRWGALIGRTTAAGGPGMTLMVIDAVTDQVLYWSPSFPWSSPASTAAFWAEHAAEINRVITSFDLEINYKPDVREPRFTTGGFDYEFSMNPPSPAEKVYTLRISSSRGDAKEVYQSPKDAPPRRSMLLGALVSPFEERALAVIREYPLYGTGQTSFRFSGAHLTLGFVSRGGSSGNSPASNVISAVFNGQEYLVRARLEAGADPNERDARGYPAILVAARLGHWTILGYLLTAGALPNPADNQGRRPLHYAAFSGSLQAVQDLLEAGADRSIQDRAGRTPADLATDEDLRALLR